MSARRRRRAGPAMSSQLRQLLRAMPMRPQRRDIRAADRAVRAVVAAGQWAGEDAAYYGDASVAPVPLLIDGDYRAVLMYGPDGALYPGHAGDYVWPLPQWSGVILYGQSKALGFSSGPVLSTTPVRSHVTFGSGQPSAPPGNGWGAVLTSPGTTTTRALDELHDTDTADSGHDELEGPGSSMARSFSDLTLAEDGIDPADRILFVSNAARSGYAADQLDEGSTWYFQLAAHYTEAVARAAEAGKTYELVAIVMVHGPADALADTDGAVYRNLVENGIVAPMNRLVQTNGQRRSVVMIQSQSTYKAIENRYGEVAKAQLAMARENPLIKIACGDFWRFTDLHFDNYGSSEHGGQLGRALKRVLDGDDPDTMELLSAKYLGSNQLLLRCKVPVAPARFNTTAIPAAAQYGIHAFDPGDVENALSDFVVQADGTSVLCTMARAPLAAAYVDVGLRDVIVGEEGRGTVTNLCDSDPAMFDTDQLGTMRSMVNFCLADRVMIT